MKLFSNRLNGANSISSLLCLLKHWFVYKYIIEYIRQSDHMRWSYVLCREIISVVKLYVILTYASNLCLFKNCKIVFSTSLAKCFNQLKFKKLFMMRKFVRTVFLIDLWFRVKTTLGWMKVKLVQWSLTVRNKGTWRNLYKYSRTKSIIKELI